MKIVMTVVWIALLTGGCHANRKGNLEEENTSSARSTDTDPAAEGEADTDADTDTDSDTDGDADGDGDTGAEQDTVTDILLDEPFCDTPLEELSRIGGKPMDVVVRDDIAYLIGPAGFYTVDVSDPSGTVTLGSARGTPYNGALGTPPYTGTLHLHGDYAYAAGGYDENEFLVYDIINPSQPDLLKRIDYTGPGVRDFALSGDGGRAYVARGDYNLEILDLSDPSTPVSVGILDVEENCRAVAAHPSLTYVYLVTQDKILVVDTENPASPVVVNTISLEYPQKIAAFGDYLYVVLDLFTPNPHTEISVLSLDDPASPEVITSLTAEGRSPSHFEVNKQAAILLRGQSLALFDLTLPNVRTPVAELPVSEEITGVSIADGRLYLAEDSVRILDVSSLATPAEIGAIATPHTSIVRVSETLAFGSAVYDIGDPHHLQVHGDLSWDEKRPVSLTIAGDYAYAPVYAWVRNSVYNNSISSYLSVIDISDPSSPQKINSIDIPPRRNSNGGAPGYHSHPQDIAVKGSLLYVAVFEYDEWCDSTTLSWCEIYPPGPATRIMMFDINDPTSPEYMADLVRGIPSDDLDGATALELVGETIYWSSHRTMLTVDISRPEEPEIVSSRELDSWIQDLHVSGDGLYAVTESGRVYIFDVSDPFAPVFISRMATGRTVSALKAQDGFLFAAGEPTLSVFDVRAPESPSLYCEGDLGLPGVDLDLDGDTAYVALNVALAAVDVSVTTTAGPAED